MTAAHLPRGMAPKPRGMQADLQLGLMVAGGQHQSKFLRKTGMGWRKADTTSESPFKRPGIVLMASGVSASLRLHGLQPARLLCPWGFPGKNTRVCGHFLLQGIFPAQGSKLGLPHCRQTLYHLSYLGRPTIRHAPS